MKTVTTHNLSECTAQEVFDFIATHLLTQKQQSMSPTFFNCSYRGADGLKCAAGAIIPDDVYDSDMEDNTWWYVINCFSISTAHYVLISDLQGIHDNEFVCSWPGRLISLASSHKLNILALENESLLPMRVLDYSILKHDNKLFVVRGEGLLFDGEQDSEGFSYSHNGEPVDSILDGINTITEKYNATRR